jgi:hypothetical protein
MGFSGWGRRCELIIQSSQVDETVSDFPVLITEDCLPLEMFDADGTYPALNGGGDIRFSSDEAGDTRLSLEVVRFVTNNNPALGEAELWVKVLSVSSSSNTSIYVWYNKSGESQPARDASYGSDDVWSDNFVFVGHMDTLNDSTANQYDGTGQGGGPTFGSGKIYNGADFESSSSQYSNHGVMTNWDSELDSSIYAWVNPESGAGSWRAVITQRESSTGNSSIYLGKSNDNLPFLDYEAAGYHEIKGTTDISGSGWHHIVGTIDVGTGKAIYYNGVSENTDSQTQSQENTGEVLIGASYFGFAGGYGEYYDGVFDEIRVHQELDSEDYIATTHNNQNAPASFTIEQTPVTPGVVGPVLFNRTYRNRRIG